MKRPDSLSDLVRLRRHQAEARGREHAGELTRRADAEQAWVRAVSRVELQGAHAEALRDAEGGRAVDGEARVADFVALGGWEQGARDRHAVLERDQMRAAVDFETARQRATASEAALLDAESQARAVGRVADRAERERAVARDERADELAHEQHPSTWRRG